MYGPDKNVVNPTSVHSALLQKPLLMFFSLSSIQDYTKGELLTGFLKKELIDVLTPIVTAHQEARKTITDEMVKEYMRPRPLNF